MAKTLIVELDQVLLKALESAGRAFQGGAYKDMLTAGDITIKRNHGLISFVIRPGGGSLDWVEVSMMEERAWEIILGQPVHTL